MMFLWRTLTVKVLPKLHTLMLNKNRIESIDDFLRLVETHFPSIKYLSLLGNTACPNELVDKDDDDYKRYRLYVIHKLPQLKFLDSRPVSDAVCGCGGCGGC